MRSAEHLHNYRLLVPGNSVPEPNRQPFQPFTQRFYLNNNSQETDFQWVTFNFISKVVWKIIQGGSLGYVTFIAFIFSHGTLQRACSHTSLTVLCCAWQRFACDFFWFDLSNCSSCVLVSGLHLVVMPKSDDPSKAVLSTCTEAELIKLAAKDMLQGQYSMPVIYLPTSSVLLSTSSLSSSSLYPSSPTHFHSPCVLVLIEKRLETKLWGLFEGVRKSLRKKNKRCSTTILTIAGVWERKRKDVELPF